MTEDEALRPWHFAFCLATGERGNYERVKSYSRYASG
jgi:hypothetical protein